MVSCHFTAMAFQWTALLKVHRIKQRKQMYVKIICLSLAVVAAVAALTSAKPDGDVPTWEQLQVRHLLQMIIVVHIIRFQQCASPLNDSVLSKNAYRSHSNAQRQKPSTLTLT